jgi:anti-anti-sigma factor
LKVMGSWLDITRLRPSRPRAESGIAELEIHGPLNLLTVADQEQRVVQLVTQTSDDLLLDLTYVTRVSAVGVQMVLYIRSVLARDNRTLLLVGNHPELRRRLSDLGVDMIVPLYPTRELALAGSAVFPRHQPAAVASR